MGSHNFIKINIGATFKDFNSGVLTLEDGTCFTCYKCNKQDCQLTGTVRGPARRPHFSLAIISVTVQTLDICVLGYIGIL